MTTDANSQNMPDGESPMMRRPAWTVWHTLAVVLVVLVLLYLFTRGTGSVGVGRF